MDNLKKSFESVEISNLRRLKMRPRKSFASKLFGRSWIPLFLGTFIGAALGLVYSKSVPAQFRATAQLQVVAPPLQLPIAILHTPPEHRSRDDDLVVLKSAAVLRNAVKKGVLDLNRRLDNKSKDEIVEWLRDPQNGVLEVKPGSKDANSDIIEISVTTGDAELSADIVQAIVSGYEGYQNSRITEYLSDAKDVLKMNIEQLEKRKKQNIAELDRFGGNPELNWKDGEPYDPVEIKVAKYAEAILGIDFKIKNIESVLQQITKGREAGSPHLELLKMALNSTKEETDDIHDESLSVESRLEVVCGLLNQTLSKLQYERSLYKSDSDALKPKMQENQRLISRYLFELKDNLEVTEVVGQLKENLRKGEQASAVGCGTLSRLEVPRIGKFAGPFAQWYAGNGALVGFCTFGVLAFMLTLGDNSRHDRRREIVFSRASLRDK